MDKWTFLSESKKIISRIEAGAITEEFDELTKLERNATEEEKQALFGEMAKHSLAWNAEEKCVEPWRPKVREFYCYINAAGEICKDVALPIGLDVDRYWAGNCFHPDDTKRMEKAQKLVKEAFKKVWEDIK